MRSDIGRIISDLRADLVQAHALTEQREQLLADLHNALTVALPRRDQAYTTIEEYDSIISHAQRELSKIDDTRLNAGMSGHAAVGAKYLRAMNAMSSLFKTIAELLGGEQ